MQKEISEEEKHISIGKFIVVAGNVLFYFVFLKKVNRMPIFIRFLTKESLVSYPYSVKKYVSFLKKILCSHAHISNKSTFSQTQSSLMSFIFFIFCKKPMLSYPYLVKKAANLPEQQTTLCHGLKK